MNCKVRRNSVGYIVSAHFIFASNPSTLFIEGFSMTNNEKNAQANFEKLVMDTVIQIDSFTPSKNAHDRERLYQLVTTILLASLKHFGKAGMKGIVRTMLFSAKKHAGVYRADESTPYFHHPLEVTLIAFSCGVFHYKLTQAMIAHDTYEDTDTLLNELQRLFGLLVREIVSHVSKKKHADGTPDKYFFRRLRRCKKLLVRILAIIAKFADRIHNQKTTKPLSEEKVRRKIAETEKEFPLLEKVLRRSVKEYVKIHKKELYLLRAVDLLVLQLRDAVRAAKHELASRGKNPSP